MYDGIIGNNILLPLKAIIDYNQSVLILNTGKKLPLRYNQHGVNEDKPTVEDLKCFNNEIIMQPKQNLVSQIRLDHLNQEETNKLIPLIKKYNSTFFQENTDLTFTSEVKHRIQTLNDLPVYVKSYRYPEIHKEEINNQITEMLRQGIIRTSNSPYNAPIWVVAKKLDASGIPKFRIVVDYRKLNDMTIDDKFPIPIIEEILDKLGRSMYFTTIDLAKGFHQIEIAENDIKKTAFSTENGHFEFLRMPFGLKNAPATFQRLMNSVLAEFIGKICFVYLDDIIIFSTSLDEHIVSIEKVLKKLKEVNLKIQIDKSEFLKKETEFLGHIITTEGIKPNPNKVSVIKNFPIPKTTKEIKQFLGLVGYYRKFIKDFANIAKPMTTYLKKDNRIDVNNKSYIESFNKLKTLIMSDPILKYPNFNKKFVLTTDASNVAIGAVLSQENHPLCYASRTLNEHETRYSTIEKELLAIIWATKYFRPYLYGRKFLIRTDHKPLQWLANLKEPNSKMLRWKIQLEEYNFDIEYLQGKENSVADALSRVQININETEDIAVDEQIDKMSTDATMHTAEEDNVRYIPITEYPINFYKYQFIIIQSPENKIEKKNIFGRKRFIFKNNNIDENYFENIIKNHLPHKGIVGIMIEDISLYNIFQNVYLKFLSGNKLLKLNKTSRILDDINDRGELKERILRNHLSKNHRGINEVYTELKNQIYCPKLKIEIQKVINNCDLCNIAKYERKPNKIHFKITETPTKPNEIIHIDVWFKQKGKPHLTVIDKFSKYAQIIPIQSRNWCDLMQALQKYISTVGKPEKIIADNEKGFNSLNFKQFLERENISIHFSTINNHTGNSDIERFHNTINEHIRLFKAQEAIDKCPLDEDLVTQALRNYNETIHSTTKNRPIDFINGKIPSDQYHIIEERIKLTKQRSIEQSNKNRKEFPISKYYVKNTRKTKLCPYYKKNKIDVVNEDYLRINNNNVLYKSQFARGKKYEN